LWNRFANFYDLIHGDVMIKARFLNAGDRRDLGLCARDGSSPLVFGLRTYAILLLDDGMSCS